MMDCNTPIYTREGIVDEFDINVTTQILVELVHSMCPHTMTVDDNGDIELSTTLGEFDFRSCNLQWRLNAGLDAINNSISNRLGSDCDLIIKAANIKINRSIQHENGQGYRIIHHKTRILGQLVDHDLFDVLNALPENVFTALINNEFHRHTEKKMTILFANGQKVMVSDCLLNRVGVAHRNCIELHKKFDLLNPEILQNYLVGNPISPMTIQEMGLLSELSMALRQSV